VVVVVVVVVAVGSRIHPFCYGFDPPTHYSGVLRDPPVRGQNFTVAASGSLGAGASLDL
jgi:hypothetical protein